jgi:hypothetical protein
MSSVTLSLLHVCILHIATMITIIIFAAWTISATTIAALLAVVCIILAACLFTLLKMYHNGMNGHSSKINA